MLAKRPTLLGAFRLKMQLLGGPDGLLSKAASLPRDFTVVIEKGNFAAVGGGRFRRELRMTFDTSPYPLLDGYNRERRGGPPPEDLYEWLSRARSFYAGNPSDDLLNSRATEDDTIMGYHTSNCVMM
jgi:hypothetical protein